MDDDPPQDSMLFKVWVESRTASQIRAFYLSASQCPGTLEPEHLSILFQDFHRRMTESQQEATP